jgi:hypothetical protein
VAEQAEFCTQIGDLNGHAHRDDGKRFIVRADELLTAFLELERAICIDLLTEQI